jgi:hypothetical protein
MTLGFIKVGLDWWGISCSFPLPVRFLCLRYPAQFCCWPAITLELCISAGRSDSEFQYPRYSPVAKALCNWAFRTSSSVVNCKMCLSSGVPLDRLRRSFILAIQYTLGVPCRYRRVVRRTKLTQWGASMSTIRQIGPYSLVSWHSAPTIPTKYAFHLSVLHCALDNKYSTIYQISIAGMRYHNASRARQD